MPSSEEDSRLQNFKTWHEEFTQRLVDTRKTEHERLKELLEEAKTHEETCDYEAARRSLNNVDKRLKDHELEKLGSAKSIRARITTVLAKITKLSTANESVKEQAVAFLEEFEFDKAMEAANEIETNDHPHLKEYDDWFVEFSEEVQNKQNAAYKQLEEQLSEALDHEENYDYEASRDSLRKVDKRLKDVDFENMGSVKSIRARITVVLARITKLSTANDSVKEQAVSLLEEFEFDKAIEAADGIETDDHPHLKEYDVWLNKFRDEVQSERNAAYKQLEEQLSEALTHEENYDYQSGLEGLTHVDSRFFETPAALAHFARQGKDLQLIAPTAKEISKRLSEKIRRADELKKTVRDRYRKRGFTGLLLMVNELLTLKPDRAEVQNLKEQLEKRDATMNKAVQQLSDQQYAEAVATLNTVSEEISSDQLEELKANACDLLKQLNGLRETIHTAVSGNQLKGLLPVVLECLILKADQDDLVKMKQDLIAREAKLDARNAPFILKAQSAMQHLQFDAAEQILRTIAPEHQTSSTVALIQKSAKEKAAKEKAAHREAVESEALRLEASVNIDSSVGRGYGANSSRRRGDRGQPHTVSEACRGCWVWLALGFGLMVLVKSC